MAGIQVALIADDLTGALDSAVPFAAAGLETLAATSPEAIGDALKGRPQVLAVNLGTREAGAAIAHEAARSSAERIAAAMAPGAVWLKKIDSRLKGHIAAEVAGVAAVMAPDLVLLCPAIPELGRTVKDGLLRGAGIDQPLPVAAALGPSWPVMVEVPDAGTDTEIDAALARMGTHTLLVGARGLAAALARRMTSGQMSGARPQVRLRAPLTVVVGSRDPITLAQVAALRQAGGMAFMPAPDGCVPAGRAAGALVQAVPGAIPVDGATVASRLAEGVISAGPDPRGTLLATGGETAGAILRQAGIGVLRILGEVQPGLPVSRAEGRVDFPQIITKSGGFGAPDSLLRLWRDAGTEVLPT